MSKLYIYIYIYILKKGIAHPKNTVHICITHKFLYIHAQIHTHVCVHIIIMRTHFTPPYYNLIIFNLI